MRKGRLVLLVVALLGIVLLADVLAGTLVGYNGRAEASGPPGKRKFSTSLRDRVHPAIQEEVGGGNVVPPRETTGVLLASASNGRIPLTSPSHSPIRFSTHNHSLISSDALALMNAPGAAIDMSVPRVALDTNKCSESALELIKDSRANEEYAALFTDIFKNSFAPSSGDRALYGAGLPWWLDEGGLIGSSRAGSLSNADDDFDFFVLLPNQTAPCAPHTTLCTKEEYHVYIHRFLMVFWNRGLCINKFNPDITLFKSNMRLMYSLQLGRDDSLPPERCFKENKPFAHMHLGIMVEGSDSGEIETNIWARHTTHPIDKIPMSLVIPTSRCRVGKTEAPCPRDIVGYLHARNKGEYFKKSSDGSCLLVRNRWSMDKRIKAAEVVENLHACGYNTMVSLAPALRANEFKSC